MSDIVVDHVAKVFVTSGGRTVALDDTSLFAAVEGSAPLDVRRHAPFVELLVCESSARPRSGGGRV